MSTSPDVDPALRGAVEAVLLVVDQPVTAVTLAQVLEVPTVQVQAMLTALVAEYDQDQRGFELREIAGGWRLYTRPVYAEVVERFVLDGQQARLTQAALETLSVVAYRQPVSRARVAAIRGVNSDSVMRTLHSRGLVEEVGTDAESGAILYCTTSYFLERIGLTSLDQLPSLAPLLPDVDSIELEHEERLAPATTAPVAVDAVAGPMPQTWDNEEGPDDGPHDLPDPRSQHDD